MAFSAKHTALCFALYIFYYDISFYKKFTYFLLLLILAPIFYILFNEFDYLFLGNIWSFYNNFENTLRINFHDYYYNNYIIGDLGLPFGSSLWGPVKIFIRSFGILNLHIWYKITFFLIITIILNFIIFVYC